MKTNILKAMLITLIFASCLTSGCQSKSNCSGTGVPPQDLFQEQQKNAQQQAIISQLGSAMQTMGGKINNLSYSVAQRDRAIKLLAEELKRTREEKAQHELALAAEKKKKEKVATEKPPKQSLDLLNEKVDVVNKVSTKDKGASNDVSPQFYAHKTAQELNDMNQIVSKLESFLDSADLRRQVRGICNVPYKSKVENDTFCKAYVRLTKRVELARDVLTMLDAMSKTKDGNQEALNDYSTKALNETKILSGMVREFEAKVVGTANKVNAA